MTVAVAPVDQSVLQALQLSTQLIPMEDISRLLYNAHIPGRFGRVHTGRWKEYDIEIKEPFGDPEFVEREIRMLHKAKRCPQIQHLLGYTLDPTTSLPLLVLQHAEHGSLQSYLANFHAHLTWSDRYNLAMDIALGLQFLHQKGIKHRHVHSSSILVDTNGSAALSDFGNTKDTEVLSSREHTTRLAYIAPERLVKNPARYSLECDVYSFGVVLWELSSGRPPFEDLINGLMSQNGNLAVLAHSLAAGRRERPVEGTDPAYEDLYARCWHASPQERPSWEWILQTLGVLLKHPLSGLQRSLEDMTIVEEAEETSFTVAPSSTSAGLVKTMSIKVARPSPTDNDRIMLRSHELILSPREPDSLPPPPSMPPPIPPVSQRRKLSAAPSITTSVRSMSISSGSSSTSSTASSPAVPARDVRRASTMNGSYFPTELTSPRPVDATIQLRRKSPQTIWEACQDGNSDVAEWLILTQGADLNAFVSMPSYSMLAEVAPVHIVCFHQPETLVDVLRTLHRNGAKMDAKTTLTLQTALHVILEHATNYNLALEAARFLIVDCWLSVNDQDHRGLTPFHKYIKNPYLSGIPSVVGSELFTLLRERGGANFSLESIHEGNALGMAARYLRADLMRLFLLSDLACSDVKSLSYALSVVEAPLSESRSSEVAQGQCRAILIEWRGERGETKRIHMAERILGHHGVAPPSLTASAASPPHSAPVTPPKSKGKGLLGLGKLGKAPKEDSAAVPKVLSEVDIARKLLTSTSVKQRKLKNLIADSGF
ncbi:hypothetical protein BGW38_005143 [Lunasporangiospora selenospora]|uniref:Protein kinase domain-containing protein n=1 Tax=Lunasporangiospora selenospora TaxID=979761 RepID=A0A9P6FNT6_9FUNG|nr:hypothetical protein BGW38_005143 [Lunasporangiospora selenospora]